MLIPLRGDFDAPGLRRVARASPDASQVRRLLALAAPLSMGARHGTPAIGSARASASGSRRCSAGSRPPARKTRHRGTARVGWMFTVTAAAYNLVRLPKRVAEA